MRLSLLAPMPYSDVANMTFKERNIMVQIVQERSDAQNPNKQKQVKMTPGQVNGPRGPAAPLTESR